MFLNCNLSAINYLEKCPNLGEQDKELLQESVDRSKMITYPELPHNGKVLLILCKK